MFDPEPASPTLPVVSDDEMAEEGQSLSPVVADSIPIACDEENGGSYVTPSTLQVVSDNKMAEEGQSPSPVVADRIVFALDEEDGVSYAQRLVALYGPTEKGEGTVSLVSGQPQFPPLVPQGPGGPNPIPPPLSSDVPTHLSLRFASQLAQYYSTR